MSNMRLTDHNKSIIRQEMEALGFQYYSQTGWAVYNHVISEFKRMYTSRKRFTQKVRNILNLLVYIMEIYE